MLITVLESSRPSVSFSSCRRASTASKRRLTASLPSELQLYKQQSYMARHIPSIRGAKPYRARLCLAGPRVRAQVSVHALEPGLARAEPDTDAQVSVSDSPASPASSPTSPPAGGAAQAAADDGAVSAASVAPDASSASLETDISAEDQEPVAEGEPAEAAATDPFDVESAADETAERAPAPSGQRPHVEMAAEDFPYQVGDVVTGRVVFANQKGARIKINGCPDILGCVHVLYI